MRVIGGRLKGRNIASPSSNDIRPTQDRLREALFNILMHAYENPIDGARVLDLFAGTGALGIEAVSRGAALTSMGKASGWRRAHCVLGSTVRSRCGSSGVVISLDWKP